MRDTYDDWRVEREKILPKEETKRKAWKGIYKFLEYSTPLLKKYNINMVKLALCGSVKEGKAYCPRPRYRFCKNLRDSIILHGPKILEEGLDIKEVKKVIDEACYTFNKTDEIIKYLEEKYRGSIISEIAKEERCSDVDGWIVVSDNAYMDLSLDPKFYKIVEEGNEEIKEIVEPLFPNISFIPDSHIDCNRECECRKILLH